MGRGVSMGRGGGMGRGMGMGGGRGLGRAIGSSTWGPSGQPEPGPLSKKDELKALKDQANDLRKKIEAIESSINDFEKK